MFLQERRDERGGQGNHRETHPEVACEDGPTSHPGEAAQDQAESQLNGRVNAIQEAESAGSARERSAEQRLQDRRFERTAHRPKPEQAKQKPGQGREPSSAGFFSIKFESDLHADPMVVLIGSFIDPNLELPQRFLAPV